MSVLQDQPLSAINNSLVQLGPLKTGLYKACLQHVCKPQNVQILEIYHLVGMFIPNINHTNEIEIKPITKTYMKIHFGVFRRNASVFRRNAGFFRREIFSVFPVSLTSHICSAGNLSAIDSFQLIQSWDIWCP